MTSFSGKQENCLRLWTLAKIRVSKISTFIDFVNLQKQKGKLKMTINQHFSFFNCCNMKDGLAWWHCNWNLSTTADSTLHFNCSGHFDNPFSINILRFTTTAPGRNFEKDNRLFLIVCNISILLIRKFHWTLWGNRKVRCLYFYKSELLYFALFTLLEQETVLSHEFRNGISVQTLFFCHNTIVQNIDGGKC